MSKLGVSVALALLLAATVATAQDLRIGESCDLERAGGSDKENFLQFDHELRVALCEQDPVIMSLLVGFPLRVNGGKGTTLISNAASLQARFQDVFPSAVRSAVLDEPVESVWCSYRGIMYGNGRLWAGVTMEGRYQLTAINLPDVETEEATKPKLDFVCDAEKHRVVIDLNADDTPRYRSWNKPRSLTEPPDLEVATGTKDYEGTGPCAHPIWRFQAGDAEFTIDRGGCFADSNPPLPQGYRGSLEVKVGRKSQSWTCY